MEPNRNYLPGNNNNNAVRRETVSELVRRHMQDENHKTTEEELRNAILELPAVSGIEAANVSNSVKRDIPLYKDDSNTSMDGKSPMPNPYDVLS